MDLKAGNTNGQDGQSEAIDHLKDGISQGKHWYLSLLEAIGLWSLPKETFQGREYRYLVGDEAFDWLLLAERLCEEVAGLIPEDELANLLFHGRLPTYIEPSEFRRLIGSAKYRAHLNYFYGVLVEDMILLVLEEEVLKEYSYQGLSGARLSTERAFRRLYGVGEKEMVGQFRQEKGYDQAEIISLNELREFLYWRFQYRLSHCDPARVASDTRKGLRKLQQLRGSSSWPTVPTEHIEALVSSMV